MQVREGERALVCVCVCVCVCVWTHLLMQVQHALRHLSGHAQSLEPLQVGQLLLERPQLRAPRRQRGGSLSV